MKTDRLGVMLDCSRNGVMNVASVKKYIDLLQKVGYNTLMLYTEDTYEVDNQPYFGYLRGRYSQEELKQIDAYAREHGIELIPCIQTLAHLDAIVRWKAYQPYTDINNILLCEDPRTYQLIEDIFCTLEKCFTARTVHIGMDEAHMVGLGKYLTAHGYQDRFGILIRHLNKVVQIAENHGFHPLMWSDMFFRLVRDGKYYAENGALPDPSVMDQVPPNVGLVYWDYYSKESGRYDAMVCDHQKFQREMWFAGGFWTWGGFIPKNAFSMDCIDALVPVMQKHQVKDIIFTMWGDNGKECSLFSTLPCLFYAAKKLQGVEDVQKIKEEFQQTIGISFDDFLLLDLMGASSMPIRTANNPDKYMFYNDCFAGIFDCIVPEGFQPRYDAYAEKLAKLADHPDYGYLFDSISKLCEFMQLKYTIGIRTRAAYRSRNTAELQKLCVDYDRMVMLLERFYEAHRTVWFKENKPHGFDVQDIRFGGLKQRIISCRRRLEQLLAGECDRIEELDEDILPEYPQDYLAHSIWSREVTVNTI